MRSNRFVSLLAIGALACAVSPARLTWLAWAQPATAAGSGSICTAAGGVTDAAPGLKVCAQVVQDHDSAMLVATTTPGTLCLGSVTYDQPHRKIQLTPDTNVVHTVAASGRLVWRWSPHAYAGYGTAVTGTVICGDVAHRGGNTRTVRFTVNPTAAPAAAGSTATPVAAVVASGTPSIDAGTVISGTYPLVSLGPNAQFGGYTCDPSAQFPDRTSGYPMCAAIVQRGDSVTVLLSALPRSTCVASIAFWPPLDQVALVPDGSQYRKVGPDGALRYTVSTRAHPHHGDHLLVAAECAPANSTAYDLRNVDYTMGARLQLAPVVATPTPGAAS